MNERNEYFHDNYNLGMNETMRAIYEHPGLDWDEINEARRNSNGKIQAIKNVREVTQCGLKEAKDLVELVITYPVPRGWSASPQMKIARLMKRVSELEQSNRHLLSENARLTSANAQVRIDADSDVKRKEQQLTELRSNNQSLRKQLAEQDEMYRFSHQIIQQASETIAKQQEQIAQLISVVAALAKK